MLRLKVHAVVLLVLAPLVASGETVQFLDSLRSDWLSVAVTPVVPGPSDLIAITVHGSLPNPCYTNKQTVDWLSGTSIFVDVFFTAPTGACITVLAGVY